MFIRDRLSYSSSGTCSSSRDHFAPSKDNFLPIHKTQSHKGHMEGRHFCNGSWHHSQYLRLPSSFKNPTFPLPLASTAAAEGTLTGGWQYHKDTTSFQVNLQTLCNSNQNPIKAFHGTGKTDSKMDIEEQRAKKGQTNFEEEQEGWGNLPCQIARLMIKLE